MQIDLAGTALDFAWNPEREQWQLPFRLAEWDAYRCAESQEGVPGGDVLLLLQSPSYKVHPQLGAAEAYATNLAWFLAHRPQVQVAALAALCRHIIDTLRGEYQLDDEELDAFEDAAQLQHMVDLSYVRIYPQSRDGLPYFALELECNWDCTHGCGIMFHGDRVVDIGLSDSAQSLPEEAGG